MVDHVSCVVIFRVAKERHCRSNQWVLVKVPVLRKPRRDHLRTSVCSVLLNVCVSLYYFFGPFELFSPDLTRKNKKNCRGKIVVYSRILFWLNSHCSDDACVDGDKCKI